MNKTNKKGLLSMLCALSMVLSVGGLYPMLKSYDAAAANITASVADENITELQFADSNWVENSDYSMQVGGGKLTAESTMADYGTFVRYASAITTDAVSFSFKSGEIPTGDQVNTMWTLRAQMDSGAYNDFATFSGYHIVMYPNTGHMLCITNPQINIYNDVVVDLTGKLFDGKEHNVVMGTTDLADGSVFVYVDVDGVNIWSWTDTTVKIAKTNTAVAFGHRNEVASSCELPNYTVTNYKAAEVETPAQKTESVADVQITTLPFANTDWTPNSDYSMRVGGGKLTAESTMADYGTTIRSANAITTDAVAFSFKSGEIPTGDQVNTMWTIRSQMDSGAYNDFATFSGYHVVMYPNTGHMLCITNPQINIYNDVVVDLTGKLFDEKEHNVVMGATDLEDGSVYVYVDVDGVNIWSWTDTTVKIAKTNTAVAFGHRNEVASSCELPNYTVSSYKEASEEKPNQKTESVADDQISEIETRKTNWTSFSEYGTKISGGKLVAENVTPNGDHSTAMWYNQAITTDAVSFKFQSSGYEADNQINTMWTVRAQMNSGSYADFPQYTGYHIVLYPHSGHVLCITNPQINVYADKVIDLAGILFDGEEHIVVIGATDLEDGSVYVYLDVDGVNVWNWTDTSVKIAKDGTSFAVGARNEKGSWCELPNFTIGSITPAVLEEYTVTFKADGSVVEVVTYNEEATSIQAPAVPEKYGYAGVWADYTLAYNTTQEVEAIYTHVHILVDVDGQAATCTEDGYTAYKACEMCDYIEGKEVLTAPGHTLVDVDGQAATCTEDGYTAYKDCANCDYIEGKEVIAAGHTLVDVEGKAATCTEAGYTAHKSCENCDYIEGKEEIPATGHSFANGVCGNCDATDPDYVAVDQVWGPISSCQASIGVMVAPIMLAGACMALFKKKED